MMKTLKVWFVSLVLALIATQAGAQCTFRNTAFKSGEFLSYNLYYNWKFVWVKAGSASFSTVKSVYKGTPAWRGSLITRGNHRVDDFFVLRDTLLCYNSLEMAPLYYRKGAREGSRYTVDEVFYSYPEGKCHVVQHRKKHDGKNQWEKHTYNDCVYDMMSIFLRARSFNPEGWKKGHNVDFPMVDGDSRDPARLHYEGKVNVKADGKPYKKIVDFFVSDDANHIPVRLDLHLRFGSAKAFLIGYKGVKGEIKSRVK